VRQNLLKTNVKYKETADRHRRAKIFKERDKVMIFLSKERFFMGMYRKLQKNKYGPYIITKKINNNIGISKTLNVSDIYLYYDDEPLYLEFRGDSRLSLSLLERTDLKCVANIFINRMDKVKPIKKLRCVKHVS